MVDTFTCFAGRAKDRVRRQRSEQAKKDNKPDGWDDGMHYYVRPVTDAELNRPRIPGGARG